MLNIERTEPLKGAALYREMSAPAGQRMVPPGPPGPIVADVTIRDADKMTTAERKRVAKWLRAQADLIIDQGDTYAPHFCGRYIRSAKGV